MGEIRKTTEAERREHERAQQSPVFLEWLAGGDAALERFLTEVAPENGAWPEPYTREGLRLAVAAARATFDDLEQARQPDNAGIRDLFVRFFGQVYIETLGGRWVNTPYNDARGGDLFPVVEGPAFFDSYIDPEQQFGYSWLRQISKRFAVPPEGQPVRLFDEWSEEFRQWDAAGRPDQDTWWQMYVDAAAGKVRDDE